MNTTAATITTIPEGRSLSNRQAQQFVHCARRRGQFVVECGWAVNEAYEDDYQSTTYHPFRPSRPQPWVGRSVTTDYPAEAARLYDEYKAAVFAMRGHELAGEAIGSVLR